MLSVKKNHMKKVILRRDLEKEIEFAFLRSPARELYCLGSLDSQSLIFFRDEFFLEKIFHRELEITGVGKSQNIQGFKNKQ